MITIVQDSDNPERHNCVDSHGFVVAHVYVIDGKPVLQGAVVLSVEEVAAILVFLKSL